MERARQIAAVTVAVALLGATTAWLFRTPQTHAVELAPVHRLAR